MNMSLRTCPKTSIYNPRGSHTRPWEIDYSLFIFITAGPAAKIISVSPYLEQHSYHTTIFAAAFVSYLDVGPA